ncbi:non-hydrolyzing UDP-N-acetylglucosamine 2-epimerase [Thermodesulfobacteriota bacterium]
MKIVSIVGVRPQFIKAAPVSRALLKAGHIEFLLHTGQHYDYGMSEAFFKELEISEPDVNLGVGSGLHGQQTGQMLIRIEEVLLVEKPDWAIVYGDTNSTLAGALAAVKLHIPVAHVEAGLRSFNRKMPEEHNRILTDHCSELLFCPTQTAVENLKQEGITKGVHFVGDVMHDALLHNIKLAEKNSNILEKLNLKPKNYALATVHRPENTDNPVKLNSIFNALDKIGQDGLPVVMPLHPRTSKNLNDLGVYQLSNLLLIEPASYLDMLILEKQAKVILTDSGGVQKEAYWFRVPCVTLRNETEWVETVKKGWNVLAGTNEDNIIYAARSFNLQDRDKALLDFDKAAERIAQLLARSNP